jgi:hypothetical protein
MTSPRLIAGQLKRIATSLQDATLDGGGPVPQMRVARRKLAPRIDDGDHGPAHEFFALEALLLDPLPMREATVQAGNFSAKNINQSSPKRPLESLRSQRWFARMKRS